MEFQRSHLPQPQQRRQVVAEDVIVIAADVLGEDRDGVDELGALLVPMLLEKPFAADPFWHADHRQRPVPQVRQHVRRNAGEVTQIIALGDSR
jgi:hypothetical protein